MLYDFSYLQFLCEFLVHHSSTGSDLLRWTWLTGEVMAAARSISETLEGFCLLVACRWKLAQTCWRVRSSLHSRLRLWLS